MINLRELTNDNAYYEINREERNIAAIFYHLLLNGDNLKRFLKQINYPKDKIVVSELAVYYEYAFVRDLWNKIEKSNDIGKRKFITDHLELGKLGVELASDNFSFNKFFGASRALSTEHIVSPANWSTLSMDKSILENTELLKKVCFLKWSFNAKPDIVIHTSKESAICIEAKWESYEGKYTANEKLKNVDQMVIQKEVMKNILKLDTEFCYLVKNIPRKEVDAYVLTWDKAFEKLDISSSLPFVKTWIARVSEESIKANNKNKK